MSDADMELALRLAKLLAGASDPQTPPAEPYLNLKQVSATVGLHTSWLWRIGVTHACGRMIAGKRRYRLSQVWDYLESEDCRRQIRAAKTQNPKGRRTNEDTPTTKLEKTHG